MEESISVHVVKYRDRPNLMMRYLCPETGKQIARSTGTKKQKEAEKVAAKWEAELQEGRYQRSARMSWEEFRAFWEDSNLDTIRASTAVGYGTTFNAFEKHTRPKTIADLTTAKVTTMAAELRKTGMAEATVAGRLRCLKSVARWAYRQGILAKVPFFDMPKKALSAKMKGRPITGEEFDRMLAAVEPTVGAEAAETWRFTLLGLWYSGLRLNELVSLRWDLTPGGVAVRLDGQKSVLVFEAAAQKSGKPEVVPLAPEAVELLQPHKKRSGLVFTPQRPQNPGLPADAHSVGKTITKIGKRAGVVVNPETGKTASAHDLRRSFGFRWSRRISHTDLKAIMRHAKIETTLEYYVGENAETTAAALWRSLGNNSGNTSNLNTRKAPVSKHF